MHMYVNKIHLRLVSQIRSSKVNYLDRKQQYSSLENNMTYLNWFSYGKDKHSVSQNFMCVVKMGRYQLLWDGTDLYMISEYDRVTKEVFNKL